MEGARIVQVHQTHLDVAHLARGVRAVPLVERRRALLGVADQEGQLAGRDDGEAAGRVARVDEGDVGDAVAGHVVMVLGLAQLLRRKDGELQGPVRGLRDRLAPLDDVGVQRVLGRDPVRELELHGLGEGRAGEHGESQDRGGREAGQACVPHVCLPFVSCGGTRARP